MIDLKIVVPEDFYQEEIRDGYLVTKETKELWAVELDLLAELDRICKKYAIEYMACGGTMLGALRHKGFIPWDDDIDVMMTWENYNRLCEIGPFEFRDPYFFQTDYTDRGSARGHIQIRNSNTTAILMSELEQKYQFNQGVFIDVFCLDHIPDDNKERNSFFEEIKDTKTKALKAVNRTYRYSKAVRSKTPLLKRTIKDILCPFFKVLKVEEIANYRFENSIHKYNNIKTKEMGLVCILKIGQRYCWESIDLNSKKKDVPFEFLQIPVPANFDNILTKTYGEWHEFVVGTNNHGELFTDIDHSYKKYI